MTRLLPLLLLALTACGAGGPPVAPSETIQPGLTVSGSVSMGITQNGGN